jgi:hypothetical protein
MKFKQIKQFISFLGNIRFFCEKEIELIIKELDLKLTNAKNRDIKHLENVAIELLGCEKNIKNPLTVLYITRYSALSVDRILELNNFIDMDNPFVINTAMDMANKGYSNDLIIKQVIKDNTH